MVDKDVRAVNIVNVGIILMLSALSSLLLYNLNQSDKVIEQQEKIIRELLAKCKCPEVIQQDHR
jgi:hypothetical protein